MSHLFAKTANKYPHPIPYAVNAEVQWLMGRTSDSQLHVQQPGFESCAAVLKPWAIFVTLHCSSSLSCINEYLAIDSDGYVYEQLRALIVAYGWMLPREAEMVSE